MKSMSYDHKLHYVAIALIALSLTACGSFPSRGDRAPQFVPENLHLVPDAVPKPEPQSRRGNASEYTVFGVKYQTLNSSKNYRVEGIASWYGSKFHGRQTSNGEVYDMFAMTAAHKTLPLPTYVKVRNLENNRSVIVRVNDQGPFHGNRIIDLSYTAAYKLGMLGKGVARVELTALDPREPATPEILLVKQTPAEQQRDYFVRAGSFKNLRAAEALRAKIALNTALPSGIKSANKSSYGMIYRVQLGPFVSAEDARDVIEKLEPLGISDAKIITYKQS
ncbi:MAG: septal ring lytic transglycosylase RlpA family protein [Gammaproteobacteria bacterium]|nr:septal ring lytic transglycosylase RlpA family protein [Gammaproteobacteria bacterium]